MQWPFRVISAGERFYFPSRTARGMWPVIGLFNESVADVSYAYQESLFLTLVDNDGNALLQDFPLTLLPNYDPTGVNPPLMTFQFAGLPINWESSFWTTSVQIFNPNETALWVLYANPGYRL